MKLSKQHVEMALRIARGIVRRMPCNVLREDLEQAALEGLLDALTKHPTGEGVGYEWYLCSRIRGSVLDELRRQDWSTRRRGKAGMQVIHMEDVMDGGSPQQFPTNDESPEDAAIRRLDAAKAWAAPLNPRDARIMAAAYQRGRKWRDIGVDEGVSEARISQCVSRALIGMRSHLTGSAAPLVVPRETRQALWKGGRR